jgi:hypothetical protein
MEENAADIYRMLQQLYGEGTRVECRCLYGLRDFRWKGKIQSSKNFKN